MWIYRLVIFTCTLILIFNEYFHLPGKLSGTLLSLSLGLQPEDGHKEMVRAVLESVAFGVKAMVDRIHDQVEVSKSVNEIR